MACRSEIACAHYCWEANATHIEAREVAHGGSSVEPSTTVTSSVKLLRILNELPLWLLSAVIVCLLGAIYVPAFQLAFPPTSQPWLQYGVFVFATLMAFRLLGIALASSIDRRIRIALLEQQALAKIYKPASALFMTRHAIECRSISAPRLSHRIENAIREFGYYRNWRPRIRNAAKALFDRQESSSAEMLSGTAFPLETILRIIRENAAVADWKLMQLARWADRSTHEDEDEDTITKEQVDLLNYLANRTERLAQKHG